MVVISLLVAYTTWRVNTKGSRYMFVFVQQYTSTQFHICFVLMKEWMIFFDGSLEKETNGIWEYCNIRSWNFFLFFINKRESMCANANIKREEGTRCSKPFTDFIYSSPPSIHFLSYPVQAFFFQFLLPHIHVNRR
jgi:hypothetical protein